MEPLNKIKITLFFSVFINVILLILLGNNLFNSLQKNTQFAPPFPLNNKEATYTIAKIGNNYVVNYKYGSLIGTWMIGTSQIELEPYLNKKVTISGIYPNYISEYPYFMKKTQCIVNKCKAIFDNPDAEAITVDITKVSVKK